LAREGHLVRLWRPPVAPGERKALGLYRAHSQDQLDTLLGALPLNEWIQLSITPPEPHPNDPRRLERGRSASRAPSDPGLPPRRHAGKPFDLGNGAQGHRRIVLTGGSFTGPEIRGKLLPGASADWQTVLPDGTALGDIRYTLETDDGALLYIRSRSVRHGPADPAHLTPVRRHGRIGMGNQKEEPLWPG
jgi:hypothetical protein